MTYILSYAISLVIIALIIITGMLSSKGRKVQVIWAGVIFYVLISAVLGAGMGAIHWWIVS